MFSSSIIPHDQFKFIEAPIIRLRSCKMISRFFQPDDKLKDIYVQNGKTKPLSQVDLTFLIAIEESYTRSYLCFPAILLDPFVIGIEGSSMTVTWNASVRASNFEWDQYYKLPPQLAIQILCNLKARTDSRQYFHFDIFRRVNASYRQPLAIELKENLWFPFSACFWWEGKRWDVNLDHSSDFINCPKYDFPMATSLHVEHANDYDYISRICRSQHANDYDYISRIYSSSLHRSNDPKEVKGIDLFRIDLFHKDRYQVISTFRPQTLSEDLQALQRVGGQTKPLHEIDFSFLVAIYDTSRKAVHLALPAILLNPFVIPVDINLQKEHIHSMMSIDVNLVYWHEFYILPIKVGIQIMCSLILRDRGQDATQMYAVFQEVQSMFKDCFRLNEFIELATGVFFPLGHLFKISPQDDFELDSVDFLAGPPILSSIPSPILSPQEMTNAFMPVETDFRTTCYDRPWWPLKSKVDLLNRCKIGARYHIFSTFLCQTLAERLQQRHAQGGQTQPLLQVDFSFLVAFMDRVTNLTHIGLPAMLLNPFVYTSMEEYAFSDPIEVSNFTWHEFYILPLSLANQLVDNLNRKYTNDHGMSSRPWFPVAKNVYFPKLSNYQKQDDLDIPNHVIQADPLTPGTMIKFETLSFDISTQTIDTDDMIINAFPNKINLLQRIVHMHQQNRTYRNKYSIVSTFRRQTLAEDLKNIQSQGGMTKPLTNVDFSFLLAIRDIETSLIHIALPTVIFNLDADRLEEHGLPSGEDASYELNGPVDISNEVWHECYILPFKLALRVTCSCWLEYHYPKDQDNLFKLNAASKLLLKVASLSMQKEIVCRQIVAETIPLSGLTLGRGVTFPMTPTIGNLDETTARTFELEPVDYIATTSTLTNADIRPISSSSMPSSTSRRDASLYSSGKEKGVLTELKASYCCMQCQTNFGEEKAKYVDHLKSHQEKPSSICPICNKDCKNEHNLQKHLPTHKKHERQQTASSLETEEDIKRARH